jgi:hypothetical protein
VGIVMPDVRDSGRREGDRRGEGDKRDPPHTRDLYQTPHRSKTASGLLEGTDTDRRASGEAGYDPDGSSALVLKQEPGLSRPLWLEAEARSVPDQTPARERTGASRALPPPHSRSRQSGTLAIGDREHATDKDRVSRGRAVRDWRATSPVTRLGGAFALCFAYW